MVTAATIINIVNYFPRIENLQKDAELLLKEKEDALIKQLEVSGKLICPVGNEKNQNLVLVEKKEAEILK